MKTFLRYEDFVDPLRKGDHISIAVFDVDDCLVITKSMIRVTDNQTGEEFSLTPAEFNEFERKSHHSMDFSDFRDLEILKAGKIIEKVFNDLKSSMAVGKRVGIITARESKTLIHQFLLHHGVNVNPKYIYAINDPELGFKGTIAERKKQAFLDLIKMGFKDFVFYDDDRENIRIAESIAKEIKGVKIKTKHITPEWHN